MRLGKVVGPGFVVFLLLGGACSDDDGRVARTPADTPLSGTTPSTTSAPTPVDPTAPEPGDDELCRGWEAEAAKVKSAGGYSIEGETPQGNPIQTRPYEPGIKGSPVDPGGYLPSAERDKLRGRGEVLLATWLPQELLSVSPVVTVAEGASMGHTVRWPRTRSSPMVDVLVYGLQPSNAARLKDNPSPSNVTIGGRPALIQHMTDAEMVSWLRGPDVEVAVTTDPLDYRINCRELLGVARSVRPFDPEHA